MPAMTRGRLLAALALTATTLLGTTGATAQNVDYPARAVRFYVPFPPGGAIDTLARITAQHLSAAWSQPVTVENRPGAGGIIGTDALAKSTADGYTLGWGAIGTHGFNAALYRKLPYDPIKDFAPVVPVAIVPNLLVVNAEVPAKNVRELIALARSEPGRLGYASAGSGTSLHLSCELFLRLADVRMLHVPYKGSGPALTDVLSGQVPVMCDSVTSALPHLKSGKLRALGITSTQRSSILPEVPTLDEAGVTGYALDPWFGIFAPAGTPQSIVARVNGAVREMLARPEVRAKLREIGAEPMDMSPAQFRDLVRADADKWRELIRQMGITAE
ncbi:MAG: tripartite tricarboxylate transporter substrate binding protein [Burkholderiaceae bacterium]